jgi:predicted nucleotidyltransferase component of viral defense system
MKQLTYVERIEFFHLAFLEVLAKRLDPSRYILKGGANLRYFFGSVRYSEDIDIDLTQPPGDLEGKVDSILASPAMALLLRLGKMEVAELSKPKQTATTRRWKVAIGAPGSVAVRTKIEFSGRERDEDRYRLDPLPAEVVAPYALPAPSVQHYEARAATGQKVRALVGRTETQARDVFDLDLLLRLRPLQQGELDPGLLAKAVERVFELPFDAYRDHVLAFLEPEVAELYEGADSWERMQMSVTAALEGAR